MTDYLTGKRAVGSGSRLLTLGSAVVSVQKLGRQTENASLVRVAGMARKEGLGEA